MSKRDQPTPRSTGQDSANTSPLFYPQSSSPVRKRNHENIQKAPDSSSSSVANTFIEPNSQAFRVPVSSSSQYDKQYNHKTASMLSSQIEYAKSSSPLFFPPSSPALSRVGDPFRQPVPTRQIGSDNGASFSHSSETATDPSTTVRVIWGTNIGINDTMNTMKAFLRGFKVKYRKTFDEIAVKHGEYEDCIYMERVREMMEANVTILNVDIRDMESYPPSRKLAHQLRIYPTEVIPLMDQALKDTIIESFPPDASDEEVAESERAIYKVRPWGIREKNNNMRCLNPSDIDKLITIKGLTIRVSSIVPDMKQAFFRCHICQHTMTVDVDRGRITEPSRCPRVECNTLNSMHLIHNRSLFCDKQIIRLQETPDLVPAGQTPHSVSLVCHDELVDTVRAGDRVQVTGIFKSEPIRINPRQRSVKALYKTSIDVVHIMKTDAKRIDIDISTLDNALLEQDASTDIRPISEEEMEKILQISQRPDCYSLLARSLAPSIFGMEDVKSGVLLQLFGGTNKQLKKGGAPRYRSDINILLCGDPSTSKSQILQYVHKLSPRGIYTSGKGSSAVGLTAYVTRDPDTRQLVLESGALVLSDGGVCCIDEFDKMNDATRAILHEVMEQQTVTIAKVGIICTLNARTSLLASANPIGSRYDPNLPVTKNIDLPPTLLSRFDLVYILLDKVNDAQDRKLARHIMGMYLEDKPKNAAGEADILSIDLLTQYISYARNNVNPKLSEEASRELVNSYIAMRKLGEDSKASERRITATTRQLESMIRLAEAHAKVYLREVVTREDVLEAARLIRSAVKEYATDPVTGKISMDLIYAADKPSADNLLAELHSLLLKLTDQGSKSVSVTKLQSQFQEQSYIHLSSTTLQEALDQLEKSGAIKLIGNAPRRMIRAIVEGNIQ